MNEERMIANHGRLLMRAHASRCLGNIGRAISSLKAAAALRREIAAARGVSVSAWTFAAGEADHPSPARRPASARPRARAWDPEDVTGPS